MNFLNSMFRLGVYEIDSKNHLFYSSLAEIAQLGERQTEDLKVPGSILKSVTELWIIPGLGISFFKMISFVLLFYFRARFFLMAFDFSKSFFPVWLSIHNDLQVKEMSTNAMGKPVKHFDLITLLPQKYLQKIVFSDVLNLYQYYTQTEPREPLG